MSDYEIVLDTHEDENLERAIAAALALTDADRQYIEAGAPVSKVIPDCFVLRYRMKVDTDGVVWFEDRLR